jgi:hypothetical protein
MSWSFTRNVRSSSLRFSRSRKGDHIQKIVAERLSDKVQIVMVPMDGKFFFTNDVLKTTPIGGARTVQPDQR